MTGMYPEVIRPELTWKLVWKAYKSSFGYVSARTGLYSLEMALTHQEITSRHRR